MNAGNNYAIVSDHYYVCADAATLPDYVRAHGLAGRSRLMIADPPWLYSQRFGVPVGEHYDGLPVEMIGLQLVAVAEVMARDARIALWCTWPLLAEWMRRGDPALNAAGFRLKTGGSWHKLGGIGQGYHWRGNSEFALIYTRGTTGRPAATISNAHQSKRAKHSAKPAEWMRDWIKAWAGREVVLDPYAGLGSVAIAAAREGVPYVGCEIDPVRHTVGCDAIGAALGGAA